jgi:hypothetical protein
MALNERPVVALVLLDGIKLDYNKVGVGKLDD